MTAGTRDAKGRKYFRIFTRPNVDPPGLTLVNLDDFIEDGKPFHFKRRGQVGFSHCRKDVRPHYVHRQKDGRKPIDVESEEKYFIVIDAVKDVFESLDSLGFDFLPVTITYEDNTVSNNYSLCDVTRVVDALDEERSDIQILPGNPKIYSLLGSKKIVFRDEVIGNSHVFRLAFTPRVIICDAVMRQACQIAKIKGLRFQQLLLHD